MGWFWRETRIISVLFFQRDLFACICSGYTKAQTKTRSGHDDDNSKQSIDFMIFARVRRVQRAALFIRGLSTHTLQERVKQLLKFVGQVSPPNTSANSPSPWHSVSKLPTLDSAVSRLESLSGLSEDDDLSPPSLGTVHSPPAWLLVELCSKVMSPADAEKASHLIVTHLPHIPPSLRPPILILVVHVLSTHRVLPALEPIIKLFIGLPLSDEHWHFNRLLRALSFYTDSPTDGRYKARLSILLLNSMTEREVPLSNKTYRVLLQNRFVTMELTEELRRRMIRDKVVPGRAHLVHLLRTLAHHGSVHDATACARAINDLDRRREKTPTVNVSKESRLAETDPVVESTTVEYLTHLVHENSKRPHFDANVEWLRYLNTGRSHRFLNKQSTSAAAWGARLFSLSRTWSFSAENLVAFFEWSHTQQFPFRTHRTLYYTIVIRGLLYRNAHPLALEVWERYRARMMHLDYIAFGVGVEVLTHAGHPDRALALLENLVAGYRPRWSRRLRRTTRLSVTTRRVPASLVGRFMRALSFTNPSAALRVWEHMGVLYDTTPDAYAFTSMLNAARWATLYGESFVGAIQELGFNFQFCLPFTKPAIAAPPESTDAGSLNVARRKAYELLEKSFVVKEGDMWGGERAWRRAHRLFTIALLAGWPALADVRPPAHAVRSSGESLATSPLRDLRRFLSPPNPIGNGDDDSAPPAFLIPHSDPFHDHADTEVDTRPPDSPSLLPIYPRGALPTFVPDDNTFRAELLLLGASGSAGEIPQMLAWMRALGVAPKTRTLAYALVYWAEVSMEAPLLEQLRGSPVHSRLVGDGGPGEYARLVRWMAEWVGAENVPDEEAVGDAMRKVAAMRQSTSGRSEQW